MFIPISLSPAEWDRFRLVFTGSLGGGELVAFCQSSDCQPVCSAFLEDRHFWRMRFSELDSSCCVCVDGRCVGGYGKRTG